MFLVNLFTTLHEFWLAFIQPLWGNGIPVALFISITWAIIAHKKMNEENYYIDPEEVAGLWGASIFFAIIWGGIVWVIIIALPLTILGLLSYATAQLITNEELGGKIKTTVSNFLDDDKK